MAMASGIRGGNTAGSLLAGILTPAREVYGIDLRSLALFRVSLALCVIADLVARSENLTLFFTDSGILPRRAVLEFWDASVINSLHMLSGAYVFQLALFLVAGLAAFCMLVGYRTRLAAVVSLLLLISIQNRNFVIIQGSDDLLRLLHFWAIFLPLGARWSVDAALQPEQSRSGVVSPYLSVASFALILQAMSVYFFGAMIKTGSTAWWPDGTAVYFAVHIDQFSTSFTHLLRPHLWLTQILTWSVWLLELLAPIVMLVPLLNPWTRMLLLPALVLMHVGFGLFLTIGLFPFVSVASLTPLVPGRVWNWLEARLWTGELRRMVMYYDRECRFCHKTCLLLRTFLLLPPIAIQPAQGDQRMGRLLRENFSWIVVDGQGREYLGWDGVAAVFRASPLFFPVGMLFSLAPVRLLGRSLYAMIGAHRGALGEVSGALLPYRPFRFHSPWPLEMGLAALVVICMLMNIATIRGFGWVYPEKLRDFILVSRIEQSWSMFAPTPLRLDGWYVIEGVLEDGRQVDVFRHLETPPSYAKPLRTATMYRDQHWRKYLVNLTGPQYAHLRLYYGGYLCRSWNADRPEGARLKSFDIHFIIEKTPEPGGVIEPVDNKIWNHRCF